MIMIRRSQAISALHAMGTKNYEKHITGFFDAGLTELHLDVPVDSLTAASILAGRPALQSLTLSQALPPDTAAEYLPNKFTQLTHLELRSNVHHWQEGVGHLLPDPANALQTLQSLSVDNIDAALLCDKLPSLPPLPPSPLPRPMHTLRGESSSMPGSQPSTGATPSCRSFRTSAPRTPPLECTTAGSSDSPHKQRRQSVGSTSAGLPEADAVVAVRFASDRKAELSEADQLLRMCRRLTAGASQAVPPHPAAMAQLRSTAAALTGFGPALTLPLLLHPLLTQLRVLRLHNTVLPHRLCTGPSSDHHLVLLVAHAPALHTLALCGYRGCIDAVLTAVARSCRGLEHIDVSGCEGLTDCGLHALLHLSPQLRTLWIANCTHISSAAVLAVTVHHAASLKDLDLWRSSAGGEVLGFFLATSQLERINHGGWWDFAPVRCTIARFMTTVREYRPLSSRLYTTSDHVPCPGVSHQSFRQARDVYRLCLPD
jgi:hypothetical protein